MMVVLRQLWFLLNRGGRMILRQTAQRWIIFVMFRREEFYWILLPLSSRKFLLGIYINISMGWWCMMLIIVMLILFMIVVRSVNTVNIVIAWPTQVSISFLISLQTPGSGPRWFVDDQVLAAIHNGFPHRFYGHRIIECVSMKL